MVTLLLAYVAETDVMIALDVSQDSDRHKGDGLKFTSFELCATRFNQGPCNFLLQLTTEAMSVKPKSAAGILLITRSLVKDRSPSAKWFDE